MLLMVFAFSKLSYGLLDSHTYRRAGRHLIIVDDTGELI